MREHWTIDEQGRVSGPCVFCGTALLHFNDGGHGWAIGGYLGKEPEEFLYCCEPLCRPEEFEGKVWRCGCVPDYVENLDERCYACGMNRPGIEPLE